MHNQQSISKIDRSTAYYLMFSAFMLGFSFPTSIGLLNISLILVMLGIIIKHDFSKALAVAKQPIFYLALLMYLLMVASLLYTDTGNATDVLRKYRKLLYIFPLALFFLQQNNLINCFVKGFIAANILVLLLSYLGYAGLLNQFIDDANNPYIFHLQITQNYFMAICCLIFLLLAVRSPRGNRVIYAVLLLLAIYNILFMVEGRTGYLAILSGISVILWLSIKSKQRITLIIAFILLAAALYFIPNKVNDRISLGFQEIQACSSEISLGDITSDKCVSSMGLRTEFLFNSINLIKNSPIIGNGVGSFSYYSDNKYYHHVNPHNEYLMQTLQSGIIGLAVFIAWLFSLYRGSNRLPKWEREFCVALIAMYMACSLFNSFILDSIEGQAWMVFAACIIARNIKLKQEHKNNT